MPALVVKDLFLQSIEALENVLHYAFGAGVQRLDLVSKRAIRRRPRQAAENAATDVSTDVGATGYGLGFDAI